MKIIGLTGGIATGKSTVSAYLAQRGLPIIDADQLAKEVLLPESSGLNRVVQEFGATILAKDGTLDRKKLAEIVFSNPNALKNLNRIVHPLVRKKIDESIQAYKNSGESMCLVLDIPLLFEAEYEDLCDEIIVVTVPEPLQLERLMKRNGYSLQHAQDRIRAQAPLNEKVARATVVIDNSGTIEQTYNQLATWLENCCQK